VLSTLVSRTPVRALAALLLVSALVVPAPSYAGGALTGSTGVPLIAGVWSGKLSSVYWDQTNAGSLKPKKKFKGAVTLTISQTVGSDALAATITYVDPLPIGDSVQTMVGTLSGNVGNFHLSLGDQGTTVTIALSGTVNKKGTAIELTGVAFSTDFTHQLTIKLKLQPT